MKASRLIFTLLLASSVAVVQLAAQQTKADQKPIGEVKAKAEAGDAESEVELGLRYDKGKGVAKDQVEAVKWYRKAAEQNYARAQNNLGVCYAEGEGVAKDQVEAVKWFRKAAEQNYAEAQYNLGVCYDQWRRRGEGSRWRRRNGIAKPPSRITPRLNTIWASATTGRRRGEGSGGSGEMVSQSRRAEYRQSAKQFGLLLLCRRRRGEGSGGGGEWYRKAAKQNLAAAQYNLGVRYYNGEGVAKDWVEAYKWLLLAARQGDEDAKKNITELESKLTPEQIADGKKRARDFKPR